SGTNRPKGCFGGPAPKSRPLLADLDQLLTRVADHRGDTAQVTHVERIAAAEQREARRRSRRTTALRLVLLATLVAVAVLAVLAYLAFGTHLPHLTLRLPA